MHAPITGEGCTHLVSLIIHDHLQPMNTFIPRYLRRIACPTPGLCDTLFDGIAQDEQPANSSGRELGGLQECCKEARHPRLLLLLLHHSIQTNRQFPYDATGFPSLLLDSKAAHLFAVHTYSQHTPVRSAILRSCHYCRAQPRSLQYRQGQGT